MYIGYILVYIGQEASNLLITDSYQVYIDILTFVVSIPKVKETLCDPAYWGIMNASTYKTFYYIDAASGHIPRFILYEGASPCFLDGFMSIYLYKGTLNLPSNSTYEDIYNRAPTTIKRLLQLHKSLHAIINDLVMYDKRLKQLFIKYIENLYLANSDKFKLLCGKFVSWDGIIYNVYSILSLFCENIIGKEIFDKMDIRYIRFLDCKELTNMQKLMPSHNTTETYLSKDISGEKDEFLTSIFFNRLAFTNFIRIIFVDMLCMFTAGLTSISPVDPIYVVTKKNLESFRILPTL